MAGPTDDEPQVRFFSPMPNGYQFVPKGDVYITKNCRKKTHEAGEKLYVVVDKNNRTIGLRCPKSVFDAVQTEHLVTAEKRAAAVQKRDTTIENMFEKALKRLFPKTPKDAVPKILKHALEKRSGRVGRTGTVELDDKVNLAVGAHIRHRHTNYDALLREGISRDDAREMIRDQLNAVVKQWGWQPHQKKTQGNKRAAGKTTKLVIRAHKHRPASGIRKEAGLKVAAKKAIPQVLVRSGSRVQTRSRASRALSASGAAEDPIEISDSEDNFSLSEDTGSESSNGSNWSDRSDL